MDSEPIPCDDIPDTYNTKYAECILKLNATILFNGFIVHGGTVTDHTLGQIDGIQDVLAAAHGARGLVDGGYTQSRHLDTPFLCPIFVIALPEMDSYWPMVVFVGTLFWGDYRSSV